MSLQKVLISIFLIVLSLNLYAEKSWQRYIDLMTNVVEAATGSFAGVYIAYGQNIRHVDEKKANSILKDKMGVSSDMRIDDFKYGYHFVPSFHYSDQEWQEILSNDQMRTKVEKEVVDAMIDSSDDHYYYILGLDLEGDLAEDVFKAFKKGIVSKDLVELSAYYVSNSDVLHGSFLIAVFKSMLGGYDIVSLVNYYD